MKRIRVVSKHSQTALASVNGLKDMIIKDMVIEAALKMYSEKMFTLSTITGLGSPIYMDLPEIEFILDSYIMKEETFKEIIRELHFIKALLSPEHKHYIDRLRNLLIEHT